MSIKWEGIDWKKLSLLQIDLIVNVVWIIPAIAYFSLLIGNATASNSLGAAFVYWLSLLVDYLGRTV
jgi:hypothetical protein